MPATERASLDEPLIDIEAAMSVMGRASRITLGDPGHLYEVDTGTKTKPYLPPQQVPKPESRSSRSQAGPLRTIRRTGRVTTRRGPGTRGR